MICSGPAEPNRRERKVIETRNAILASARTLIEEQGYDDTTVEQIADHADVATRTFFRYFPTKESVLFAEFDDEREAMIAALENRPEDEDLFDSLAITLRDFAAVIDRKRDDFTWAYQVAEEQVCEGSYERAMMRKHIHARIGDFIASRLGVSVAEDPRPIAWASAVMSVFGHSMAFGPYKSTVGSSYDTFIAMLKSTEKVFKSMSEASDSALAK